MRSDRSASHLSEKLARLVGGNEESPKATESLKVRPTIFFKFVSQAVQIGDTIFHDHQTLCIKPFWTVEEIYDAPADDRIQCHERSFVLASHMGPPFFLMGFPEG